MVNKDVKIKIIAKGLVKDYLALFLR